VKIGAAAIIGLMLAYAIIPLDIVPDTVPVLGWIDDLILVPVAFTLIDKLLPQDILAENRSKANRRVNRVITTVVLGILAFLAAGAATVGCAANMIGFAVASFRENRYGGLVEIYVTNVAVEYGPSIRIISTNVDVLLMSCITRNKVLLSPS